MECDENYLYLLDGIEQLAVHISDNQITQLIAYLKLLNKWNKIYSLTAITNIKDMIDLHLLDGLSILSEFDKLANVRRVVDVGSGMGVPGVILSICRPDITIVVLDSNHKKTAFLQQVKIEIGLSNLHVLNHRVEDLHDIELFDVVISRAFADTGLFIKLSRHLAKPSGVFLAMKGQKAFAESTNLKDHLAEVIEIKVPHLAQKRFLTKIIDNK